MMFSILIQLIVFQIFCINIIAMITSLELIQKNILLLIIMEILSTTWLFIRY